MTSSPHAALIEGVLRGDVRSIARSLRLVDDRATGYLDLLRGLFMRTGSAYVVGVTGNPGAGKSTLVDKLVEAFRAESKRVAVLAVDPTSPFSGGAILGDRIRMQKHFLDDGVFIRSLATRGAMGGLSRSAADAIRVLDAAGFDVIIVETVGVGQDELEVTKLAHTSVVIVSPGMGDDIQAIKAGILEVADIFAVNKADRDGADSTVRDLEHMLSLSKDTGPATKNLSHGTFGAHLRSHDESEGWRPPILKTVASKGQGVAELVAACHKHRAFLATSDIGERKLRARAREHVITVLREGLASRVEGHFAAEIEALVEGVFAHEKDAYEGVDALLHRALSFGTG